MAAGDPQRVWFPEMIERLRSQWHQDMSFDAIVNLRDEPDEIFNEFGPSVTSTLQSSSAQSAGTLAKAQRRTSNRQHGFVNATALLAGNRPAASSPHSGSAVSRSQRPDSLGSTPD